MLAKFKNNLRIVKSFTYYGRWLNAFKIVFSYYVGKLFNRHWVWGLPFSIAIEPTTACNLRCPHCPSGLRSFSRNTGKIAIQDFENYIEQIYKHTAYITLYFQGEPYLNPAFYDLIAIARKRHIFVATSTNAHFLDMERAKKTVASGINQIIISIDGASQEAYQKYRIEGEVQKVIEGSENLVNARNSAASKLHIIWQIIVFAHNEHEVDSVRQLAAKVGIDELRIKSAQIYDSSNAADWLPSNAKYRRYKVNGKKLELKSKLNGHCKRLWTNPVVTWDGNVVPCCFDKDAVHNLGNLNTKTFKQIWNDTPYKVFRKKLKSGRGTIDICSNCSEGVKVWL